MTLQVSEEMYALKLKFKGRIYLVVKEQMATERVVFFSQLQTHMAAHAGWKKKSTWPFSVSKHSDWKPPCRRTQLTQLGPHKGRQTKTSN